MRTEKMLAGLIILSLTGCGADKINDGIPAAGIGFKVRNTDTGEYIVQHINYPTPVDIDIYYTDVSGKLYPLHQM